MQNCRICNFSIHKVKNAACWIISADPQCPLNLGFPSSCPIGSEPKLNVPDKLDGQSVVIWYRTRLGSLNPPSTGGGDPLALKQAPKSCGCLGLEGHEHSSVQSRSCAEKMCSYIFPTQANFVKHCLPQAHDEGLIPPPFPSSFPPLHPHPFSRSVVAIGVGGHCVPEP